MQNSRRVSLALAALALSLAASAHADAPGDAWAAARGGLPATPYVVMGANLATIKGSTLYQQLVQPLLAQSGGAKEALEKINARCGIDVIDAAQGAVVAIDEAQKGAIFLSTKGIDAGKVTDCLGKMAAEDKKPKKIIAGKPDGHGIIEFSASGEPKKLYIAFLPKGVLAMATDAENKGLLEKWLTGKGSAAASPTARALGAVNTGAAVWMVMTQEKAMDPPLAVTMKVIYGTADVAGGNINADFRVVTGNPKQAGELAAYANKQADDVKKSGQMPPEMVGVMKTLRIVPNGEEVQVKASLPEAEALALISSAMGGGGAAPAPAVPAK